MASISPISEAAPYEALVQNNFARMILKMRTVSAVSPITPSAIQRCIPTSVLYRQRSSPCRRLTTLMRPSHPVRHLWPLRNQRFFCSHLGSGRLLDRSFTAGAFRAALVVPYGALQERTAQ